MSDRAALAEGQRLMSYVLARYPNPATVIPTRPFYVQLGTALGIDPATWDAAQVPEYETVGWLRSAVMTALQSLA